MRKGKNPGISAVVQRSPGNSNDTDDDIIISATRYPRSRRPGHEIRTGNEERINGIREMIQYSIQGEKKKKDG